MENDKRLLAIVITTTNEMFDWYSANFQKISHREWLTKSNEKDKPSIVDHFIYAGNGAYRIVRFVIPKSLSNEQKCN